MVLNTTLTIFDENIQRGIDSKIISFAEDFNRITYNCSRAYSTSFRNPEELVRASYFVELVLDYLYDQKKIDIEVKVERRTPDDRADIVVYQDFELKTPYLIVEVKRDGITDSEFTQAIEQAFGNANSKRAKYAIVVAGNTKTAFDVSGFNSSEREKNVISDIPVKFGSTPKYRFSKGGNNDLKIAFREDLISALKKSHGTVWQGGKLAPTAAFDEVSKLLFCKLKDEKLTARSKSYEFQIGSYETIQEVFFRIQRIYSRAKTDDPQVFTDKINLEPQIVYNVVEHLQQLSLNNTDLDTKGVAFEIFMRDFFIGKMGQFFTPRPVVQFCVKMLSPLQSDKVIDPSCGSGGFLLFALDEVRQFAESNYDALEAYKHWHDFASKKLFGIEINDQIARVCKMNMIIHDDGHTNVIGSDALEGFEKFQKINADFKEGSFDIVLSNPPFGSTIKAKESNYLKNFYLGCNDDGIVRKTQKSEILFIERVIKFAKPKTGRIAIVLPEGVMTNTTLQYVRNYIIANCQIEASISLPESAFSHFGAGIKSSILFLRRLGKEELKTDYPVFMAVAKQVGISSTGREEDNDLYSEESTSIFKQWELYKRSKSSYRRTENCYVLKLSEIVKEGPLNATRHVWSPVFENNTDKITSIADIVSDKITPSSSDHEYSNFALIRMDEIENNPVKVENVIFCLGGEIDGGLKIVKEGDILLARLGPSMMNRKIIVVPEISRVVDYIVASPEFIIIRPHDPKDAYYITGILRTNMMLKYMYSKTRGGTPSRYRLSEDDFKKLDFPLEGPEKRRKKSLMFEQALQEYNAIIVKAEESLIKSHSTLEADL